MFSRCIFEVNAVKFVNGICALKGFDEIQRIENVEKVLWRYRDYFVFLKNNNIMTVSENLHTKQKAMKQIYVTKIIVIFVPFNLFYLWIEKMFRLVWCVFIILQEPLNFANHFNEFKQIFCCNANGYMSLNTSQKTCFYKILQSRIKQQKFNLKHCVKHSNKLQFLVFVLRTCSSYISGTGHFLLMFIRLGYTNLNVLN